VYRDGNTWVRRPEPRGITVDLLLAAPSVHVDFRDSPESHHSTVVKSYPRNWQKPGSNRDDQRERRDDKDSRKDDDPKDKKTARTITGSIEERVRRVPCGSAGAARRARATT
jgi:hypothetical protein